MSPARPRHKTHIVVDGSNIATEGRSEPSLAQLRAAVEALALEYPQAEVLVIVDASLEHKLSVSERAQLKALELSGEIVAPPAGSVGRGDAFILKIAERIGGVVLSNDSFHEFQGAHSWLFDEGRLLGGKPVPKVGWIFTERIPVKATSRTPSSPPTAAVKKTKAPSPVKAAKAVKTSAKSVGKKKPPVKVAAKKAPAKAVTRDRVPVNSEVLFEQFLMSVKVRSHVEGVVVTFTSHGAVIKVAIEAGSVECYAPNSGLGTPPPVRARDVLKRGETRRFRLRSVDRERRIPELVLVQ